MPCKKIFFVIPDLISGGAQRTFVNILNQIDKKKYECILVVYTKKGVLFKELNKEIKVISLECSKSLFSIFRLSTLIRKSNPHIVFSTLRYVNFVTILSCLISLKKIKIIIRETNNHTESKIKKNLKELLIDYVYRFSDKIIALSEGVRLDISKRTKIKILNIEVIYNPINLNSIMIKKNYKLPVKYENEFSDNSFIKLINVGHLEEQKGQDVLIKAVKLINEYKFKLYIIGEGSKRQYLENLIKKLDLEDKVVLLGFQDNPYNFMKKADIFILSSLWEGFGHVIVEAMACNTPVISSDCKSGPNEIIDHDIDGILTKTGSHIDLNKKINQLALDDNKRNKLIKNANYKMKKFEDKVIVKSYENLFNNISGNDT